MDDYPVTVAQPPFLPRFPVLLKPQAAIESGFTTLSVKAVKEVVSLGNRVSLLLIPVGCGHQSLLLLRLTFWDPSRCHKGNIEIDRRSITSKFLAGR